MNLDLNNQAILITGATGSFGKKFIQTILDRWPNVNGWLSFPAMSSNNLK